MKRRSIATVGVAIALLWLVAHHGCGAAPVSAPPTSPASPRGPTAAAPALEQKSPGTPAARTPDELRAVYTRLLDQKIGRYHEQVDGDCSHDDLRFVFDDLARVRDAIVASAVEAARGGKTKDDQHAYENRVLKQHRTDVCRWAATAALTTACAAHFRFCSSPADQG